MFGMAAFPKVQLHFDVKGEVKNNLLEAVRANDTHCTE